MTTPEKPLAFVAFRLCMRGRRWVLDLVGRCVADRRIGTRFLLQDLFQTFIQSISCVELNAGFGVLIILYSRLQVNRVPVHRTQ